jgi:hypothetical protein
MVPAVVVAPSRTPPRGEPSGSPAPPDGSPGADPKSASRNAASPPTSLDRTSPGEPPSPPPTTRATTAAPVEDLVCSACGARPDHFFLSQVENKIIHAAPLPRKGAAVRICGGEVVHRGEEWLALFAPGSVVPAFGRVATKRMHRVRLGRRVAPGGASWTSSWTGTALCGELPDKAWFPASAADLQRAAPCPACEAKANAEADADAPSSPFSSELQRETTGENHP